MDERKQYEAFLDILENFIFVENEPQVADIIFVPGNAYPQSAERAAQLYREGFAPLVLPSGKYSILNGKFTGVMSKQSVYNGEYSTEWEFLREVLLRGKVPPEAILREDRATYTMENAVFSRQRTDLCGLKIRRAILCCKTYHARRALMYYRQAYPETEFFVCPSSSDEITKKNWRVTQQGIAAVTGEIARILRQFSVCGM